MKKFKNPIIFFVVIFCLVACVILTSKKEPIEPVTVIIPNKVAQQRFDKALSVVLKHEGGFTDDKNDPGGATNWGISLRFLKEIGYDVDKDGDVDRDDIFKLTKTDADKIYLKNFWDKYNFDDIDDLDIAIKLFDTCVNVGPTRTQKLVRSTFNEVLLESVPDTGPIDSDIVYMLNMVYPEVFMDEFRRQQAAFYESLIKSNPKLKKYEKGWLNRAAF